MHNKVCLFIILQKKKKKKNRCCGNRKTSWDFKTAAAQRPGGVLQVPTSMGRYIRLTRTRFKFGRTYETSMQPVHWDVQSDPQKGQTVKVN